MISVGFNRLTITITETITITTAPKLLNNHNSYHNNLIVLYQVCKEFSYPFQWIREKFGILFMEIVVRSINGGRDHENVSHH